MIPKTMVARDNWNHRISVRIKNIVHGFRFKFDSLRKTGKKKGIDVAEYLEKKKHLN